MQKSKFIHTILCPYTKQWPCINVIILIKSVSNKDKSNYHYNVVLERCSYQLSKNNNNK